MIHGPDDKPTPIILEMAAAFRELSRQGLKSDAMMEEMVRRYGDRTKSEVEHALLLVMAQGIAEDEHRRSVIRVVK